MQSYNSCRLLIHGHSQEKQQISGFLYVCKGAAFAQQCVFPSAFYPETVFYFQLVLIFPFPG